MLGEVSHCGRLGDQDSIGKVISCNFHWMVKVDGWTSRLRALLNAFAVYVDQLWELELI